MMLLDPDVAELARDGEARSAETGAEQVRLLGGELRRTIDRGGLEMVYQPSWT